MKTAFRARQITLLGLLTAIVVLMSVTPLGYLQLGPLALTFSMIPVAVAAVALGPTGGAIVGAAFGVTSFLQAMGIGGGSPLGTALFAISPFRSFLMCFGTRLLTGFLTGLIGRIPCSRAGYLTGFAAAFLNTALFMGALVALFGKTDYVQALMGGKNVIVFVCTFVGVQAVLELLASTVITGIVIRGLERARMLGR